MKATRKKEYNYFDYFIECSEKLLEAAQCLDGILTDYKHEDLIKNVSKMHTLENNADQKNHDMFKRLAREFMTPIEREDIVSLGQKLDDIMDAIEDVMQRIYMFDIKKMRPDVPQFTSAIVRCCEAFVVLAKEFPNFKKSKVIHNYVVEVNTIESNGDKLYVDSMRTLMTDGTDIRDVIVWMTMYECMENCLDTCEDAAQIISNSIMKNS